MKKRQRSFMTISEFEKRVYDAVRRIPRGKVKTYKQIAEEAGYPKAFRAVGNALNKNPYTGKVPCHRVIKSDNTIGGFSKGVKAKRRMLKKEGTVLKGTPLSTKNAKIIEKF